MMLSTLIGAATLALGPCDAAYNPSDADFGSVGVIEIRPAMLDHDEVDRRAVRFSDRTRGEVVAVVEQDGTVEWEGHSDRELLGGQDAPALIYVQMFDGVFAIDPFQPLPEPTDSTAEMFFLGTSLETDRTQFGRKRIDRTKELFRKLEQARVNWLHDNGFYGVRTTTNPRYDGQQPTSREAPEPSAVIERPVDMPRTKSREQVKADDQPSMSGVVAMLRSGDESVRVSTPHGVRTSTVARLDLNEDEETEQATDEVTQTEQIASNDE